METVGALAMGVSHEFNNALEIILGNAELAFASKDPEAIKKGLNTIIESARRASWIIKNMLDFSGKEAETRMLVDLEEVLRQNISFLSKTFESQGIELDLHFSIVPRLYGNSGQLSQAFVNIMMNAREAMRGGIEKKLTITMEYSIEKSEVRICFKDTGPGIKQEIKDKIFGPFVTTKGILGGGVDKKPGVGLGLFVSYGIIKQHNGSITVESQEGEGATFCVTLPTLIEERFG
jgi:signal transduction histidine kinase